MPRRKKVGGFIWVKAKDLRIPKNIVFDWTELLNAYEDLWNGDILGKIWIDGEKRVRKGVIYVFLAKQLKYPRLLPVKIIRRR
ncbi:MAG: hypothetical protein DRO01_01070 [Thermoproteota archaeon]|mgnify:CR=1 FL=1|nr:MAG: hypothetical protein DRO01_01070 [Candidatus Korarchaeota archaeon]RLG61556.1 MAG: hypothetical protein DRN87_02190 [Candidatus Geothermarchaeota archaeon]